MTTIRDAMTDSALFGAQFAGDSWLGWRALLAGFYGLPLDDAEAERFTALTGREGVPESAHDELWLVVGRRGGKSQCAALLAVYEAAFKSHADKLAPGEVATVAVLAADRKQARAVFRYVAGLLRSNPMTERMIAREDREAIELTNRAVIEITTASYRSARGYTFAAVIADEIAFWRSEDSANPDAEVIAAVRPGLATLGGPLVCLSSPYAKRGELWRVYRQHYGEPSPVLVAQAPSRALNPGLPERVVDEALARDQEAATRPSPLELPFDRGQTYSGFVDPAGGGQDEFTLAIGHREDDRLVVDLIRARRGQPAAIVAEYADLLKAYGIREARSDRYGGSWPSDEFSRHAIRVEPAGKPKSDLYQDCLSALNSGRVELPPDDRTLTQFMALERRTSRFGRDSIDHQPGGADDRANAVAGLVASTSNRDPAARMAALNTW